MRDWPVTNARRFELYVRWSLYFLLTLMPLQFLTLVFSTPRVDGQRLLSLIVLFLLSLPLTVCNVLAARWCLNRVMRGPAPTPRWFLALWLILLLAVCAGTLAQRSPAALLLLSLPLGCTAAAVCTVLSARATGMLSLAAITVGVMLGLLIAGIALAGMLMFLFLIWTAWSTGWMLRVLRELQRAHQTASQLALAEERLRISRDLHDVFGRTLATISVKSELAAELSRREHYERAAAEMAQIRQIANTAGAEVRRVVRDERPTSWADELEGARTLLTSAGVDCVVTGEEVPETYAETLAWVIREGVTNVLRHSRATQVTISATIEPHEVALTLANDGAGGLRTPADSMGTGLRSMAERVRAVGGVLDHETDGDWFILTASIPTVQEGARDSRIAG